MGGYSDWLAPRPTPKEEKSAPKPAAPVRIKPKTQKLRMSYKELKELEVLPQTIETLETEQTGLIAKMSETGYHARDPQEIKADNERLKEIEVLLTESFDRWEALETKRAQVEGS